MITQIPINKLLQSQHEQIATYKWIESERFGFDIGVDRARAEWFDRHFTSWVQKQRQLIDHVLAAVDSTPA